MSEEPADGIPPEVFQNLLAKYRESLPDRLKAIEEAAEMLRKKASKEGLSALRFLVHKLAGNAGTFGYGEVSRLCQLWEEKLAKMTDEFPRHPMDVRFFTELTALFKKIREEFKLHER